MDDKKSNQAKEMYVIKHNDLIRARYNLTTQQQKIIAFSISKIKPNDKPGKWYEISIEEFCKACGLVMDDTGFYYKSIKEDLKKITNRLWIQLPDKREITFSWLSDAEIVPLSGKVYVKFHEKLDDLLFLLNGHYTQYKFDEIAPLHYKYSIRLYELIKERLRNTSISTDIEIAFSIKELRETMAIVGYTRWPELERNVIRKAVEEINKYSTEYRISYDTYKHGKNIETIIFIVRRPTVQEIYGSQKATKERMSMQRKPAKKTASKKEKARELIERTKEIESRIMNPAFEANAESTRELLEINKELAALIPGERAKKGQEGSETK